MKARLGLAVLTCAAASALVMSLAPAALAATPTISGSVTCANNKGIEGVWVQSSVNGSKFATLKTPGAVTTTYSATISTALPTNISLHVGCGGSTQNWASSNFSPAIAGVNGSITLSVTNCVNGQCSPLIAYKAAQWALAHLTGAGADHALPTDLVADSNTRNTWAWYCLAFVASAYMNATGGTLPNPTVSGESATAAEMYTLYYDDHLIQKAWANDSGEQSYPPEGALVFYPGLPGTGGQGHIGISVGGGNVVTANASGSPLVREQGYNSLNLKGYYEGWAFPLNAGN
jgi:cell wall-associated NlpC family hydrolase